MSAAINYANKEWGWQLDNPAQGQRLKEPNGRVRWITQAEADALIRAAEATRTPHLADFIRLALHTGMRRGEILGLEWRRVDLQAGLIHLEAEHTKTGHRRSVPLNAHAAIINRARFRAQHFARELPGCSATRPVNGSAA